MTSQKAVQLWNDQVIYEHQGLVPEPELLTTMAGHLLGIDIPQINKIVLYNKIKYSVNLVFWSLKPHLGLQLE